VNAKNIYEQYKKYDDVAWYTDEAGNHYPYEYITKDGFQLFVIHVDIFIILSGITLSSVFSQPPPRQRNG
jgi:hypothetical protein